VSELDDESVVAGRAELRGLAASPGIATGEAYVLDQREVHVPRRELARDEIDDELKRVRGALRRTHDQFESIKGKLPHGEHRQILKAQQMMLRDPDLVERIEDEIRDELRNAEWAVAVATDAIRDALARIADEYLSERAFDVAFIAKRVIRNLSGEQAGEIMPPEGAVVVAHELSPADTASLHQRHVAALVTQVGGSTSHTAIIARALEIPCVVGVDGVLDRVQTGQLVAVDAVQGRVVLRPEPAEVAAFREEAARYADFERRMERNRALPAMTKDGLHVPLRANVALEEELDSAASHGAEGVGLYRTEFMFMNRDAAPHEAEHYRVAKSVLQRCAPYPVVMRTFDLGSDKPSKLFEHEKENNPALGRRGLRLALRERDTFLAQLRGLLRAALHGPLHVMLPLVGGVEELDAALDCLNQARSQLEDEGMAHAEQVSVGAMIEVPSAVVIADLIAAKVDFLSIGTNDLIQYALAIDRENDAVNYLYAPLHPAILRMVRDVCRAGREAGIRVCLCGEMAADPLYTWVLVGLGVQELSMNPGAIPIVKSVLRSSSVDEMTALADEVLTATTAEQAERIIRARLGDRFAEHLRHRAGASERVETP
jgi:phosphotransferase system enzyme I (PtsI)